MISLTHIKVGIQTDSIYLHNMCCGLGKGVIWDHLVKNVFFASISFLDQLSVRNQKFITFEAILKGQVYLNAHITQVAQISRKYIHCNSSSSSTFGSLWGFLQ